MIFDRLWSDGKAFYLRVVTNGRLKRLAGRAREVRRYSLARPGTHHDFVIVSSERNAGPAALQNLDSVYRQTYSRERIRHVFIDDASTDDTARTVEQWLERHPRNRVEFIRNSERKGGHSNNLRGFTRARPGDIVIELNGDDWLPDRRVLSFLNQVYQDPEVWMTYNTARRLTPDGKREILLMRPIPPEVMADNSFREMGWIVNHLHSFRAGLFFVVPPETQIDPLTGDWWETTYDQAVYLPMLEMAGTRSIHIHRVTCVYRLHEQSHFNTIRELQAQKESEIRKLPRFTVIDRLDGPGSHLEEWKKIFSD